MKNIAAFFLLIFGFAPLFSQGQVTHLTKQQMLSDIDTLESIINRYHYNLSLLEKRTGSSPKAIFSKLRASITDKSTMFDYVDAVRQGLGCLNDGHTSITGKSSIKWYLTSSDSYLSKVGNATLSDTLKADYYQRMVEDSIFSMSKSGFRAKYINGKYYNARPFTFNGKLIDVGAEIRAVDGEDVNKFVNRNYSKLFFLRWDPYDSRWYSDYFALILPYLGERQFTLNIGGIDVLINSEKQLDNLQKEPFNLTSSPKVLVLGNILYVYIPAMMNSEWYVKEIKTRYSSNIKKVVLDIRGNGGGDDSVWERILESLLDEPLSYRYSVGMNYSKMLGNAISDFGDIKIKGTHMVVCRTRAIYPDSSSVRFGGKIYILQDKDSYSAAAALASAALQNKKRMKVIGERSSLISGYTFPALLFSLPQSKIAFKLGFSADLAGGSHNPYMDKVDVYARDSASDYFGKRFKYDCHSVEYLNERDKLIRLVKCEKM
jgi:Periplasmic protease